MLSGKRRGIAGIVFPLTAGFEVRIQRVAHVLNRLRHGVTLTGLGLALMLGILTLHFSQSFGY